MAASGGDGGLAAWAERSALRRSADLVLGWQQSSVLEG